MNSESLKLLLHKGNMINIQHYSDANVTPKSIVTSSDNSCFTTEVKNFDRNILKTASGNSSPPSSSNIYATNSPTAINCEPNNNTFISSSMFGQNNRDIYAKTINSLQNSTTTPPINSKPKVRFNLDINYEKEREWNRVNKIIGDASKSQIEWTQEVEV